MPPKIAVSPRNDWIDLLRGWSILAVILLHINIRLPMKLSALGSAIPKPMYSFFFASGAQAVSVFFVISGFLITSLALQRYGNLAQIDLRDFYRKRIARLLPCLLLFIALQSALQLAGVSPFVSSTSPTSLPRTIVAALGFHLNWIEARDGYLPGAWDVLWSLSVEEVFYFVFPLACLLLRRPRHIVLAAAILLAIGPFARTQWTQNEIWADHAYLSCVGEIALGCVTALFAKRWHVTSRAAAGLSITGVTAMVLILYFRHFVRILGLYQTGLDITILGLGTAMILLAANSHALAWPRLRQWALVRGLCWYGRNSYEGYLVHMFVVLFAVAAYRKLALSNNGLPLFYIVVLLASGVMADALARTYSQAMNTWLRGKKSQTGLAGVTLEQVESA